MIQLIIRVFIYALPLQPYFPSVRVADTGDQIHGGTFAGAVAAHQREDFPFPYIQGKSLHHIGQLTLIAEPDISETYFRYFLL